MSVVSLRFESQLAASPATVWAHASTMAGVNAELGPWLRMSHPAHAAELGALVVGPGKVLFQSWLLVLGIIPFDRHALCLERLLPGSGFDERSSSWLQKSWVHRRRILPSGSGSRISDELEFEPRLGFAAPMVKPIIRAVFQHRHRQLLKKFGAAA